MAWTAGYWFDADVRDMSRVTADYTAPQFQYRAGSTMTIAPGDFLVPARASLEEFATRGVKVFYKLPGKSKNSAAVLPNKLSKSCELRPERVFNIAMVFGDVPSG